MGLFEKKYCDFCGEKIGLLGNRKLEDGNMCKTCAAKLSPWFSERRKSTKAEILAQLDYREANKRAVEEFHVTRSYGTYTKLLLDEDARKFTVTSASNLPAANPDILSYSQVTGCNLDIHEQKTELFRTGSDGKRESYSPPRYEYSYDFRVSIQVNHPFFNEMEFSLSNGYVKIGERSMTGTPGGWTVHSPKVGLRADLYYKYINMGNEVKEVLERMRTGSVEAAEEAVPEAAPVICPFCESEVFPDETGCCPRCGGPLGS